MVLTGGRDMARRVMDDSCRETPCSMSLMSGTRFSTNCPPAACTRVLSPSRTLISWRCANRFTSAHSLGNAELPMNSPIRFLARSASPVLSGPASTRAAGGSEVSACLSAASTCLVITSRTVSRTAGFAATGLTAATYPLVDSTVPRIQALATATGSSMANAAASAAAAACRARFEPASRTGFPSVAIRALSSRRRTRGAEGGGPRTPVLPRRFLVENAVRVIAAASL